jgi:SAM-dependent methyltransferase
VSGLDVNEQLIELARERTAALDPVPNFVVGSATSLPWPNRSMDVCLLPELLEHVVDWQTVVHEAARVLKPGGFLYLSTTNKLCPIQDEFNIPGYSWYPGFLKYRYERLAVTSRPELVNHAKYPAVHWFTYFGLRGYLVPLGFRCMDRFDVMDRHGKGLRSRVVHIVICNIPPFRFLAHVATPYTALVACKEGDNVRREG